MACAQSCRGRDSPQSSGHSSSGRTFHTAAQGQQSREPGRVSLHAQQHPGRNPKPDSFLFFSKPRAALVGGTTPGGDRGVLASTQAQHLTIKEEDNLFRRSHDLEHFRIEEAAIGSGDKCGATFVDREFLGWLEHWIGRDAYQKIPPSATRHGSNMMKAFEFAKCNFSGDDDDMEILLPAECGIYTDSNLNIKQHVLTLKKEQMELVFDPCVNRTLELIDGQVDSVMKTSSRKPKMVFVVGGFGSNPYLYSKIEEYCSQRSIAARFPPHPWSAAARAAVCRGLEIGTDDLHHVIVVRLARQHYGTPVANIFQPGVHDPEDMFINRFTGLEMARGQMSWLSEKGERLPDANPKKISIDLATQFEPGDDCLVPGELVGCYDDEPPARLAEPAARFICRVQGDFNDVPLSTFPKSMSPVTGREYYEIDFKLEATFRADDIEWRLMYRGKEYGKTTVTYDQ
ncbi:hypothetical protein B0T24DRAFT_663235 [Lasiosphaeria ovina]|uniref:Uncharacterized protein n=1 Tax=Lasiosphaeria ovina TaxID=92902 RepID=A0AAE0NDH7_9PEZI|nr:hypothetical protein B0T24DRAFT_663235 [Lasiosphaeria ovina]